MTRYQEHKSVDKLINVCLKDDKETYGERNMRHFLLNMLLIPLGCLGGSAPSAPPPPAPAPEAQDRGVVDARDSERRRRQLAAGNTNFTGPRGVPGPALTQIKNLTGQ